MNGEMLSFDISKIPPQEAYKFLIGGIIPRPIAFISTISNQGITNLAPFSFFNGVCSKPAAIMFSATRKSSGDKKDTLKNIEETGQFVVNFSSEWLLNQLNQCSAEYPHGISEFEKAGLTPLPSVKVKPPRVKESWLHMECELYKTLEVGEADVGSAVIVVGRLVMIHVMPEAYDNGRIKADVLKPIARLGGIAYATLGTIIETPRPKL